MFHHPANSPWYGAKRLQRVSKQRLISHTPGVHQQLKMVVPKVRNWFVMSEFAGNLDARWSIAQPNAHINQFEIRNGGVCRCARERARICTKGLTYYNAIDHKSLLAYSEHVFYPHFFPFNISPLIFFPVLNIRDPCRVDRPQWLARPWG